MYLCVAVSPSIYLTNIYWRIYCILDSDVGTGDVNNKQDAMKVLQTSWEGKRQIIEVKTKCTTLDCNTCHRERSSNEIGKVG